MKVEHLRTVSAATSQPGSVAQRVQGLQEQARRLAREHVMDLVEALAAVETLSKEIATGGDAYHAGIRDIAKRLAEDSASKAQTISAINGRAA